MTHSLAVKYVKNSIKTLAVSAVFSASILSHAALENAHHYSELGDMLSQSEAIGRFDWLEKCYSGLLVEIWERTHDATQVLSEREKIDQLQALWLSQEKIDSGQLNYLTFANADFTNPYAWYAGKSANDACTTMPIEYEPVALKTTLLTHQYCETGSFSNEWEWIESVTVNQSSHVSGSSPYTLVSGKVFNLYQNQQVDFSITSGTFDPTYTPYMSVRVWIDLDQNGAYETSEMIHHSSGYGPYNFDFIIPKTSATGMTTMRISADNGGGYDNPCKRIDYGEVEDYLVNIQ